MFSSINNPCDKLSIYIASLLEKLSIETMQIEDCTKMLLKDPEFNTNPYFIKFVYYFDKGKYYHYQCEGYMKCLTITKCYSPMSINYWLNELVYPAAELFDKALECFDRVKKMNKCETQCEYLTLIDSIDNFKDISNEIMKCIEMYNF